MTKSIHAAALESFANARAKGLTITQLAEVSGLTRANVSEYLAGKRELRSDGLERLVAALGVRIKPGRGIMPALGNPPA